MAQGVFLGFDFGTKYIGIAVGQVITQTASPLTTLAARNGVPNWEKLNQIIEEWQPQGLIVGLALQLDGSHSPTSLLAKKFGQRLQKRYAIEIYYIEERLTTVAARERLKETYPDTFYQEDVDSMSAVIILESWLKSGFKEIAHHVSNTDPI